MVDEEKDPSLSERIARLSEPDREKLLTRSLTDYKPPQPTLENFDDWERQFSLSAGGGLGRLNTIGSVTLNYERFFRVERQFAAGKHDQKGLAEVPLSFADTDKQTEESLDFLLGESSSFVPKDARDLIVQSHLYSASGQALLYVATHVHEKLNKALHDLITEARHYSATVRAEARGLPIPDHKRAAKDIANTERSAIESRLTKHNQRATSKGGRPPQWDHATLLEQVNKAVASLKQKNSQRAKKAQVPTLDYATLAGEMDTTAESIRKLIQRYMKTDWETIRSEWATDFNSGRNASNGHNLPTKRNSNSGRKRVR